MIRCPFHDGVVVEATLLALGENEEMGFREASYRCPSGHEFTRPQLPPLIRSIGWGHRWREQTDRREE